METLRVENVERRAESITEARTHWGKRENKIWGKKWKKVIGTLSIIQYVFSKIMMIHSYEMDDEFEK